MRTVIASLLVLGFATPALARPGFYIGLGFGGSTAAGETSTTRDMTPDAGAAQWDPNAPAAVTTDLEGGASALFTMGFNVLGYGAVEARLTGQGQDLDSESARTWAAHWSAGLRLYPMWHWQQRLPRLLQPLEPSLFAGLGGSYQGYFANSDSEVGWADHLAPRFGAGLEYFVVSFFKVAVDYAWIRASYDRFYYDYGEGLRYTVDPAPRTSFHQVYLTVSFQFGPSQEPVRYARPDPEPDVGDDLEIRPRAPAPEAPAAEREPEPASPAAPASGDGGDDDWI